MPFTNFRWIDVLLGYPKCRVNRSLHIEVHGHFGVAACAKLILKFFENWPESGGSDLTPHPRVLNDAFNHGCSLPTRIRMSVHSYYEEIFKRKAIFASLAGKLYVIGG